MDTGDESLLFFYKQDVLEKKGRTSIYKGRGRKKHRKAREKGNREKRKTKIQETGRGRRRENENGE